MSIYIALNSLHNATIDMEPGDEVDDGVYTIANLEANGGLFLLQDATIKATMARIRSALVSGAAVSRIAYHLVDHVARAGVDGGAEVVTSLTDSGLTAGRVVIAGTGGLLADDADLTFVTDTLTAKKLKMSDLTAARVPYAGTGGLLTDSTKFTYDDTTGLALTVDVAAAGGFRRNVDFVAPGAAGVLAADQTNLDCVHIIGVAASGWVAPRAGSIMGLSAQLSAAITTAGAAMTVVASVTVNGTEVACIVTFTTGGAEVKGYVTKAKDAAGLTFAAGDVIGVSYTSTTISNTPAMTASVEVEC